MFISYLAVLCGFQAPPGRLSRKFPVVHSERETPLPIPNRAVKPFSADGTWGETSWESRSPPVLLVAARVLNWRGLRRAISGALRPRRAACVALLRGATRRDRIACFWPASLPRQFRTRTAKAGFLKQVALGLAASCGASGCSVGCRGRVCATLASSPNGL